MLKTRTLTGATTAVIVASALAGCTDLGANDAAEPSTVTAQAEQVEERPTVPEVPEADDPARLQKNFEDTVPPPATAGKMDPYLDANGQVIEPDKNSENYEDYGVNPFVLTARDRLSTFSVDVDTGSYTIARRKLRGGTLPPRESVRVEEFVNYFRYDYPDPENGAFSVHFDGAPSPFDSTGKRHLVRVGVQGKRATRANRKPAHLVFLVDVSGSMSSRDKLSLAKRALKLLTNNLGPGDTVALATYAGRVAEILPPTGIHRRGEILSALDSLKSGGSTAMNSGLKIAYKLAQENYDPEAVNRVIVLSDGDANVGPSSHDRILEQIEGYVDQGITLSTIGFGMGNYNDTMMEQLANKGNGNYYYLDSMDEARKVFGEQLDGTLQVIAKDVKIQVEFDPKAVEQYRLIGYENRDIADEDFRDDSVDAGEIGAGHSVTALYEVVIREEAPTQLATVRIRHKEPTGDKAEEIAYPLSQMDLSEQLSDTSHSFQFATAVTTFAEVLRESPYASDVSYDVIEEVARSASSVNQKNRQELIELVGQARLLASKRASADEVTE